MMEISSLQRLDDRLATGMTMTDTANARWLTAVEVLKFLDGAHAANFVDWPLMSAPPSTPPTSGTLLLYNYVETPKYREDGIEWISDQGTKWKSIEAVLAKYGDSGSSGSGSGRSRGMSDSDSMTEASGSAPSKKDSSESSSAVLTGASAEYLSCATRTTFHRREYRGPNNLVLLHYLDSVRALRMTSELVDRIVLLSADADANLPPVAGVAKSGGSGEGVNKGHKRQNSVSQPNIGDNNDRNLGETMNILMGMVGEHDASGTIAAEAVEEHVLKATTDAAFSAVMKHISPEEAAGVVDAIEMAMDGLDDDIAGADLMGDEEDVLEIEDVTALDISEAINQVLSGNEPDDDDHGMEDLINEDGGSSAKRSVSSSSDSGGAKMAQMIENRILDSMDEVIPDELKSKLINTTEIMLDAAGVSLRAGKGNKKKTLASSAVGHSITSPPGPPMNYDIGSPNSSAPGSTGISGGHALPEIIDMTPDFHVVGYQPLTQAGETRKGGQKVHLHNMVLSTATPIPTLPPFADQYYCWERYAAFVDFQEVADDPLVRNVSFNRMTPLSPFSYKIKIPTDIPNYSVRHIVVVGVLLPKDHRVKRNLRGIELALKLTLQTEWNAAADLAGAYAYAKKMEGAQAGSAPITVPFIKGIKRPIFMAPCGGARMQLLSQISKQRFTMYPASSLPGSLSKAMSPDAAPNFVQRVAMRTNKSNNGGEKSMEVKRKRDNYLEEWAEAIPDATLTTAEVDRHRKVRFVERIAKTITNAKGESDALLNSNLDPSGFTTTLDGEAVEDMPEEEIDQLLGRLLMRYVEVCIGRCTTEEELMGEINWNGYSGLSLLHHACFYNFMPLITLLFSKGADPNILSAEGDLTPMHFAAAGGFKDVVDVLIKNGCTPTKMDVIGDTPADHARRAGHVEVAAMLSAYNEQAGIVHQESTNEMDIGNSPHIKTSDVFLQSAFRELSLKDKLGLNLFVDRSNAAPMAFVQEAPAGMITDGDGENLDNTAFSFISEEDRAKLREAMSMASEMDLKEMNSIAEHQDVRRYLRQSNYEAINAASQAMDKARKKELNILKSASENTDDPSKMQLSRALAMLVLRKNLPTA